jgi:hypothetical protein
MSRLVDAWGVLLGKATRTNVPANVRAPANRNDVRGRNLDPITAAVISGNYDTSARKPLSANTQGTRTPDMNTPQTPSWSLNTPNATLINENWFGPGVPLRPVAPPEVAGRRFDFPVNTNVNIRPRSNESVSFDDLRALADNYDLMRLVIETRKEQVESYDWEIVAREDIKGKGPSDLVIQQANDFFMYPDKENVWNTWLRMMLEDLFVIDGVALYPRKTRGGDPYAIELIDAATIKRVLDPTGRTPMAPDPAYQQVLHGLPAVDYTNEELLYFMRNPRTNRVYGYSPVEQVIMTVNIAMRRQLHQLQFYCYSDDTEVMTRNGWKRFADCAVDDEFATRQIGTGVFEWQAAYDTFRKHYTGEMLHFTGKSLDLLVTPNHRMLVNCLPKAIIDPELSVNNEYVISAEQMAEFGTTNTGIPQTSIWAGAEIGEQAFRDTDTRSKDIVMSGDDYCAFMGMYLAEGNLRNKEHGIAISQPPDERGAHEEYKQLLERIFGSVYFGGHQFEVSSKPLSKHLSSFGKSWQKFIPDLIREATPRQLEIFWRYYYLGDGRAAGDNGVQTQCAFTVSRRLADHLTEIGQKMGYAITVWTRQSGTAKIGERTINSREGYMVSFSRRAATKGWTAEWVDYDAPVACVCVPNKFLYVRRNGKTCWSGNTEGSVPEAFSGVPENWNMDQISKFQQYWDTMMEGNTAQRRKVKFIPMDAAKMQFPKQDVLKDLFDEWLARIICFAFSISPTALVKETNRATATSAQETALKEGLVPLLNWLKRLFDRLLKEVYGTPNLEFKWAMQKDLDPLTQAQVDQIYVITKVCTPDEVRERLGLDPLTQEQQELLNPSPAPTTLNPGQSLVDPTSGEITTTAPGQTLPADTGANANVKKPPSAKPNVKQPPSDKPKAAAAKVEA